MSYEALGTPCGRGPGGHPLGLVVNVNGVSALPLGTRAGSAGGALMRKALLVAVTGTDPEERAHFSLPVCPARPALRPVPAEQGAEHT